MTEVKAGQRWMRAGVLRRVASLDTSSATGEVTVTWVASGGKRHTTPAPVFESWCVGARLVPSTAELDAQPNMRACHACGKLLHWVTTQNGATLPVESDGSNHFSRCKDAALFRQKRPRDPLQLSLFPTEARK